MLWRVCRIGAAASNSPVEKSREYRLIFSAFRFKK